MSIESQLKEKLSSKRSISESYYFVNYELYPLDSHKNKVIVKANDENEAIEKAQKSVAKQHPEATHFIIDNSEAPLKEIDAWKESHPDVEIKIYESEDVMGVSTYADAVSSSAAAVMIAYQNANKWLDIIKEYVLMFQGCVFFSNYIHNLAHTMPARFDKFGDILHTADLVVPYPPTEYIPNMPVDIPSTFQSIYDILDSICASLRAFIKVTQDTEGHALSCSAEELLVDISGEFTDLYRMNRAYTICNDPIKFDKWVAQYLNNKGTLID